jgi:hypothetical protein
MNISRYANIDKFVNIQYIVLLAHQGKAVTDSFQISVDYVEKHADLVSSAVTDTNMENNLVKKHFTRDGWNQGLKNSLARFFRNSYEFRAKITVLRSTVYLLRISDYCRPETVPHLNIIVIT